jgi:hypothetical protein
MRTFERFRYSHLDQLRTVYLAGDMDAEGEQLRQKLAEYFGEARCRIVEWHLAGDGTAAEVMAKDANEMLMTHGADAVLQCMNHARPCPITGVETVGDYRERAKQIWLHGVTPGKKVGWGEFDDHVQFEAGRSLIIVGEPNTGKSTFADDLILNLALLHGWKAALYSPEMFPPERHIDRLATTIAGRRFRKEEVVSINIPAGVSDGMTLRMGRQGNDAPGGGVPGDLLVVIEEVRDAQLTRDGNDLIYNLMLDIPTAVLGGKVEVPTVDGKARVTIKPGTQPGSILRLRGKGLPSPERYGSGDLLVNVMVYMPEKLNEKEKEAFTMLQNQGEHVKPNDSDKSRIFSRLRHIFD